MNKIRFFYQHHKIDGVVILFTGKASGKICYRVPELVNENETPPATIYCSAGSLLVNAGLLIQTAVGNSAGVGVFPLNRFGFFS